MAVDRTLCQGSMAWFEMVGVLMCKAAARSGLSPNHNLSLVERYTDGVALSDDLIQGLRFDIIDGRPSFRAGARIGERADITIEVTAGAARTLNTLYRADPNYVAALKQFLGTGEMRIDGDPAPLNG